MGRRVRSTETHEILRSRDKVQGWRQEWAVKVWFPILSDLGLGEKGGDGAEMA
jgi:hypothetical protein